MKVERLAEILEKAAVIEERYEKFGHSTAMDQCRHIKELAAEVKRLDLLLIRKSEALAVFADPKLWRVSMFGGHNWKGADVYGDPIAFAKRESEATEPDNRGEMP